MTASASDARYSFADRDATAGLVTLIMGTVVAFTFLFGFGNSLALGLRLGVPVFIAPLVAPAVDLSVVGLLLAAQHLSRHGAPRELLRPARRLLIFSSAVTLALNIAEPLIAHDYGKAAFDAVGPLLLIGWSEVGPGLLQAMRQPSVKPPGLAPCATQPGSLSESGNDQQRDGPRVPTGPKQPEGIGERSSDDLLAQARREDAQHWEEHLRPIPADELRKRLKIGSKKARTLVRQLRADALRVLGDQIPLNEASWRPVLAPVS